MADSLRYFAKQRSLLEHTLQMAGIGHQDLDLLEAHGTGTNAGQGLSSIQSACVIKLETSNEGCFSQGETCCPRLTSKFNRGDVLELTALARVFTRDSSSEKPLLVGALKTNIGHSEGAAGILSTIKAVLCMCHQSVPMNLHYKTLVDIGCDLCSVSRATLPTSLMPLQQRQLVGVSSFGFGGAICEVILEAEQAAAPTGTVRNSDLKVNCFQQHPLLGKQFSSSSRELTKLLFHNVIDISQESNMRLRDHRVAGCIIFPAEGYLEMMLTIARLQGERIIHLQNIRFLRPLDISQKVGIICSVSNSQPDSESTRNISVHVEASRMEVARGQLAHSPQGEMPESFRCEILPSLGVPLKELSSREIYSAFPDYGTTYKLIETVKIFQGCALGKLRMPVETQGDSCLAAPVGLFDAALQVLATCLQLDSEWVPIGVGSILVSKVLSCQPYKAFAWWDGSAGVGHVKLVEEPGEVVATLRECHFAKRSTAPKPDLRQLVAHWEEVSLQQDFKDQALQSDLLRVHAKQTGSVGPVLFDFDKDGKFGTGTAQEIVQHVFPSDCFQSSPLKILYFPSVITEETWQKSLLENVESASKSLLEFSQALCTVNEKHRFKLIVVTNGAVHVRHLTEGSAYNQPSQSRNLVHSILNGMCQSLRLEEIHWNVVQIDLESSSDLKLLNCCIDSNEQLLVLRDGQLRKRRWQAMATCSQKFQAKADDHFLITGGLGGSAFLLGFLWDP